MGRRWWGPRPGCCLPLHTPSSLRIRPLSHLLGSLRRGVKDPRLHCQKPPGMWLRVFKGWGPGGQRGFQPHRALSPSIISLSFSYPSLSPFFVSFLSPSLPSLSSSLSLSLSLSHTHTHTHTEACMHFTAALSEGSLLQRQRVSWDRARGADCGVLQGGGGRLAAFHIHLLFFLPPCHSLNSCSISRRHMILSCTKLCLLG